MTIWLVSYEMESQISGLVNQKVPHENVFASLVEISNCLLFIDSWSLSPYLGPFLDLFLLETNIFCLNDEAVYTFSEANLLPAALKTEKLNILCTSWELKRNSLPPYPHSDFRTQ